MFFILCNTSRIKQKKLPNSIQCYVSAPPVQSKKDSHCLSYCCYHVKDNTVSKFEAICDNKDPKFSLPLTTQQFVHASIDSKFVTNLMKNNTNLYDFNDKNLDNLRFVKVSLYPALGGHITPKTYVGESIEEPTP